MIGSRHLEYETSGRTAERLDVPEAQEIRRGGNRFPIEVNIPLLLSMGDVAARMVNAAPPFRDHDFHRNAQARPSRNYRYMLTIY